MFLKHAIKEYEFDCKARKLGVNTNGRDFVSIRNKALLSILFDTGMRLNEVVSLKREQIHEEYILVHGKGNKERLVPVSPFLGKALMRYLVVRDSYFDERKIPDPYVFVSYRGHKMHQQFIGKLLKEIAEAVGVRKDIRVSPHTCRHTFAHLQLKNGLDLYSLSRLMGHENIAITQRYLDGMRTDQVLKAAQKTGVLQNFVALRYDKHLPPFSNCKQAEKGGFCMHFSDAITEYCFDCKVRKLSPKSISNYQKQLKYLQRYEIRNKLNFASD